ncbi:MAG: AAA family ATPase [Candidatus Muirbacterium halophilum]|nr:AAA family ATPase [Candidatus Muirbacterium halophilum]MCK9477042.1 AAA family ATPase [Candidatus Muirbacterium halophilum]
MGKARVKMKFCESLDRFVQIREFTEDEINKIFKNINITDKKSYKRLIISTAIVNYIEEISPLVFGNNNYSLFGEITEQELYNLCIQVNPSLDIKNVTITLERSDEDGITTIDGNVLEEEEDITERLINMEKHLRKRIVGQEEAIKVVSQAIRKAHVGLKNPEKPIGSFMFAGPTGVGKTELAKALAEFLFGDERELIRIDCSEYSMSHEYAKLIGAPPGYIGHKEGGFLTEAIKNKPKSIVLFDELEKAHRKMHNVLLQILDDGILTDNHGEKIIFKDTVIIMTTNVGVEEFQILDKLIGFGADSVKKDQDTRKKETGKALEKNFPPEFLNRIDEMVTFTALTKEDNMNIFDIMIKDVVKRLESLGMGIDIPLDVKEFIVDKGTNLKYGARPLKRSIKTQVENPLSEGILNKDFVKGCKILSRVDNDKDKVSFEVKKEKKPKKKDKEDKEDKKKDKKTDCKKKTKSTLKKTDEKPKKSSKKKKDSK